MGAMIFFLDEAGFQSDPPLGRTYGLKGQTPVVESSGQRQSINVISAVNASGAFWSATYTGKLDAESFVIFLRDFMKGRSTKVFLVVDGHPAHKAKIVKSYVAETQGGLELYFLPPYSPDLNPDAGHGAALIDPYGDLAEELLRHIPPHRADHLVYFNPADLEFAIGMNLLANVPRDSRHLVASGIVSVRGGNGQGIRRDFFGKYARRSQPI